MSKIKAGFSRLDITPHLGAPIAGYYEKRYTKGVLDDLYVSAAAFDDGEKKSVIIAVDIVHLSKEQSDYYRKLVADFCNIPFEAVFVNCSHTHTGPIVDKKSASGLSGSPLYEEYLGIRMRDVAAYAFEDLADSDFYSAEGSVKGISFIRRYRMKDGTVQTNPGVENPNIDHALGTPNESVRLLKIVRPEKEDIYIVSFGTHPDTIGGEYISADFPGVVCSTVEAAIPDTKCMFLLAPQGDVNAVNPYPSKGENSLLHPTFDGCPRGYEFTKHMGRTIAGEVLKICGTAEKINADCVSYASKDITIPSNQENDKLDEAKRINDLHKSGHACELPYEAMELTTVVAEAARIVALENGPDYFVFTLSAIKIGDMVFAGIPGEPFTELGNRIYEGSPFETTLLCCLTNGGDCYFPSSAAYDEGGYEARSSTLKKGGDDIVVNGMIELLNSLK